MLDKASDDVGFGLALNEAISLFRCSQDLDIEIFLHDKARNFIRRGWCAVYLLFNEAAFEQGRLVIEAYFTLSHKSMVVDREHMSGSVIKKYGGLKEAATLDFVLIGQLGKYIADGRRSELSGRYILEQAFEIIYQAAELIPCKFVLVECGDAQSVQDFYKDNGFSYFQRDGYNQYTKKL